MSGMRDKRKMARSQGRSVGNRQSRAAQPRGCGRFTIRKHRARFSKCSDHVSRSCDTSAILSGWAVFGGRTRGERSEPLGGASNHCVAPKQLLALQSNTKACGASRWRCKIDANYYKHVAKGCDAGPFDRRVFAATRFFIVNLALRSIRAGMSATGGEL
jgi:hypothetical protein